MRKSLEGGGGGGVENVNNIHKQYVMARIDVCRTELTSSNA